MGYWNIGFMDYGKERVSFCRLGQPAQAIRILAMERSPLAE
jgi:hypothetical protein